MPRSAGHSFSNFRISYSVPNRALALFVIAWLAVLSLGALVYLPGLPGGFIFDDYTNIINNSGLANHAFDIGSVISAIARSPNVTRPLSTISFALNFSLFGDSPLSFKLTNIGIHLCVGIALFFLAREILRAYNLRTKQAIEAASIAWLSLAVSALWLVHPINLTSVLYVVQRETSLAALFMVLAAWSYLVGRRRQLGGKRGAMQIWILTPAATLTGLLCKENAALVPSYLLGMEFVLLGFRNKDGRLDRGIATFYGVFVIFPLCSLMGLLLVHPSMLLGGYAVRDFTLQERLLTECRVIVDYIRWIFMPDPRQLGLFHDDIAPSRGLFAPPTTCLAVFAVVMLIGSAFWCRKRLPLMSLGLFWFFAGHLMESTFIPLELVFEHRNYLPSFGLLFATVTNIYLFLREHRVQRFAIALGVLSLATLSLSTAIRASEWSSKLSFAQYEALHHPRSPRAIYELGWNYMALALTTNDKSLAQEAVTVFQEGKRLDPNTVLPDMAIAGMYVLFKDEVLAEKYLQISTDELRILRPDGTVLMALNSLLDLAPEGPHTLWPSMALVYRSALANPKFAMYPCFEADIWDSYGIFLKNTGDITAALHAMRNASSLCPGSVRIRMNFMLTLLNNGYVADGKLQLDELRIYHPILQYFLDLDGLDLFIAEQTKAKTKLQ